MIIKVILGVTEGVLSPTVVTPTTWVGRGSGTLLRSSCIYPLL